MDIFKGFFLHFQSYSTQTQLWLFEVCQIPSTDMRYSIGYLDSVDPNSKIVNDIVYKPVTFHLVEDGLYWTLNQME